MNDKNPVHVVEDTPDHEPEHVKTPRFDRKKIAKIAGTAAAVLGGLVLFAAAMKQSGKNELAEDLEELSKTNDETPAA